VPYYQNVYDLLQLEPGESPEALRMIAEHEAQHGPLPASVREWYLVPNVVPLRLPVGQERWNRLTQLCRGTLWWDYSEGDIASLEEVLHDFAQPVQTAVPRGAYVINGAMNIYDWYVVPDGSDDPPVWRYCDESDPPNQWTQEAAAFSEFVSGWMMRAYRDDDYPLSRNCPAVVAEAVLEPFPKPYLNGFWLRAPAEPFHPPVIDFLIENFGEPERTPRPGNVTTYTFRPARGTIRITADEPALSGGLSAWWVHAETRNRYAEFLALLLPWGTLRHSLRADCKTSLEMLQKATGVRRTCSTCARRTDAALRRLLGKREE
jgi:hypothetical protein